MHRSRQRDGHVSALLGLYFTSAGTENKDSMDTIYSFIEPIMHEVVAKRKEKLAAGLDAEKRSEGIDESESFLDNLVKYTDGTLNIHRNPFASGNRLHHADPIILRDEILNIMIAGRDTVDFPRQSTSYLSDSLRRQLQH